MGRKEGPEARDSAVVERASKVGAREGARGTVVLEGGGGWEWVMRPEGWVGSPHVTGGVVEEAAVGLMGLDLVPARRALTSECGVSGGEERGEGELGTY